MGKKEWKRLTVCLDPKDYQSLRIISATSGHSMSDYVRLLILNYIQLDKVNLDKPKQP